MRLQVGPLPSTSARAWISYAREKIDDIAHDPFESEIPADILEVFNSYLSEWSRVADSGDDFSWEADVPGEIAEYQAHAFHQIVNRLAQAAIDRGQPEQPAVGEQFYLALVDAIIDGLQMEGASTAEYAAHLRSFWPGVGDSGDATDETA